MITDIIRTKRKSIYYVRTESFMSPSYGQKVYIPQHGEEIANVQNFLQANPKQEKSTEVAQYFLAATSTKARVELPPELIQMLSSVVEAMSQGEAVSIAPYRLRLTTQQAAEFLNISRPTLVRLLENGSIPFEKIGKHRKVSLKDVIAFQEQRISQMQESLAIIQGQYEDIPATAEELKRARKVIAARRALKNA